MSLPSSYSAILSELNREVLRAQPSDPLQFCANWFAQRLEQDRIAVRSGAAAGGLAGSATQRSSVDDSSMREATPPLSAKSLTGETPGLARAASPAGVGKPPLSATSAGKAKQSNLPFGQGYAFGAPAAARKDDQPSPFSEYPPDGGPFSRGGPSSSSARAAGGAPPSGLRGAKTGSTTPPDFDSPAASSGANRFSRQGAPPVARAVGGNASDTDEDVEDPRDDPNFHPGRAPGGPFGSYGSFGGAAGGPGGAAAGAAGAAAGAATPIVNYNLGRRTSVSAESLDPDAATQALPKTVIPKSASQRQRIEKAIANNLLFRNLDEDQHTDVLNAMKEVTVQAGTEVIVQGAVGDFFYVVEEGTFEVWVRGPPTHTYAGPGQSMVTHPGEEKKVATYGPGGSFGELALMYNAPRAATVVATSRATMWALDRVTFRSILVEHTSRKRKMYEAFLGEVSILQELNAKERAKIADALEEKVYDEGEVGKNFYIIESGRAEVTKRRKARDGVLEEELIGVLGKGDYFGELALINSAPRAATVRAKPGEGRLRVATLGEKAFTRLLGPIIDILARKAERAYGPGAAVNATGSAGVASAAGDKRENFGNPPPGGRGITVGGGDA
ncbi:cAMP-dependent protein kinase regulatory subunit BCY1 [Rhodotorula paludigena]|uniref:cAMP-dependent protein kinase regulatory subunit BCY1 n=1 Tax=Rhodotorula paludigena TaxID=86838 RepID=UPI00316F290B